MVRVNSIKKPSTRLVLLTELKLVVGRKQPPPSDDLSKQIACLSRNILAVFVLLLSIIISLLKLVQVVLGEFGQAVEKLRLVILLFQ